MCRCVWLSFDVTSQFMYHFTLSLFLSVWFYTICSLWTAAKWKKTWKQILWIMSLIKWIRIMGWWWVGMNMRVGGNDQWARLGKIKESASVYVAAGAETRTCVCFVYVHGCECVCLCVCRGPVSDQEWLMGLCHMKEPQTKPHCLNWSIAYLTSSSFSPAPFMLLSSSSAPSHRGLVFTPACSSQSHRGESTFFSAGRASAAWF